MKMKSNIIDISSLDLKSICVHCSVISVCGYHRPSRLCTTNHQNSTDKWFCCTYRDCGFSGVEELIQDGGKMDIEPSGGESNNIDKENQLIPFNTDDGGNASDYRTDSISNHMSQHSGHFIFQNIPQNYIWCGVCKHVLNINFLLNLMNEQKVLSSSDVEPLTQIARLNPTTNSSTENGQFDDDVNSKKVIYKKKQFATIHDLFDIAQESSPGGASGNGVRGLPNLGNTCFMNAALQCIFNNPLLIDYFVNNSSSEVDFLLSRWSRKPSTTSVKRGFPSSSKYNDLSVTREFMHVIQEVRKSATDVKSKNTVRSISPHGILGAVRYAYPIFHGFQQQDAQEFLRCFLDLIHEELAESVVIKRGVKKSNTPIQKESKSSPNQNVVSLPSSGGEQSDSGLSDDDLSQNCEDSAKNSDLSSFESSALSSNAAVDDMRMGIIMDVMKQMSSETTKQSANNYKCSEVCNKYHKHSKSGCKSVRVKRSIISDVFDGQLKSCVQCYSCKHISTRMESFQDLSLSIPTSPIIPSRVTPDSLVGVGDKNSWWSWVWSSISSWFYISSSTVRLEDCLASFFTTDELTGDNMYSCGKCKKLRNGCKYSRITQLPNTLCIHLKRFRHDDFLYTSSISPSLSSSKINAKVTFPITDLNMREWMDLNRRRKRVRRGGSFSNTKKKDHQDYSDIEEGEEEENTIYDLSGVIVHHGLSSSGGHYTSYALNPSTEKWYHFDDAYVEEVDDNEVLSCQPYVLFYTKSTVNSTSTFEEEGGQSDSTTVEDEVVHRIQNSVYNERRRRTRSRRKPRSVKKRGMSDFDKVEDDKCSSDSDDDNDLDLLNNQTFYVSRRWFRKLQNFFPPGPIDNSDFLCWRHMKVVPEKYAIIEDLVLKVNEETWNILNEQYGTKDDLVCTNLEQCGECESYNRLINNRRRLEISVFKQLHSVFQDEQRNRHRVTDESKLNLNHAATSSNPMIISSVWFKKWESFVHGRDDSTDPPGHISNHTLFSTSTPATSPSPRKQQVDSSQQTSVDTVSSTKHRMVARKDISPASYVEISENMWNIFVHVYGGGPPVIKSLTDGNFYIF